MNDPRSLEGRTGTPTVMPMSGAKDRVGSAPEHEGATSVEARFGHPISPVDRIDEEVGVAKLLQNLGLSDDDDARGPLQIGQTRISSRRASI